MTPGLPSKMLLVDDDPSMVRLLSAVLQKGLGDQLSLETCTDPSAAAERIEEGDIDILLTDLDMPVLNGLDLLKAAKRRNATCQVLFFTGQSTQAALLEAFEHGASDYLLKPIDHAEFTQVVSEAHARIQRWRRALGETWKQRKRALAAQA